MRILLPTDFSDNSFNAITYALKLFKDVRCTFYLLNTYTPIIYNYDFQMEVAGGLGKVQDVIKNNSVDRLEKLKADLSDKYATQQHTFEVISSFNTLIQEVKEKVTDLKIDLIVMGTKGASGIKEVLFGTNTVHIIKNRVCPVLAVPEVLEFKKPSTVLFPTDFEINYTKNQLALVKAITISQKAKLHVLHSTMNSDLDAQKRINKELLETMLSDTNFEIHLSKDQLVIDAINEFQDTHDVHLLIMVNNKHSFFENLFFKPVINQIGFQLTTPFLVIPSEG